MSDEEIEYIGTQRALKRPLTGIALNVEKYDNNDAYRLVFNRANGCVIHIGRRPGADSTRSHDNDSGNAMFRCAVVSRKHAKIAFSDNGNAYIIDLNSHHGTHLRKAGQLSSKMLKPEEPMLLSDGDVITFGKTVGRNEDSVRPVVVRVELLRNPQPIKPLVVPSPASDKSSSGRYGIYTSSGSSDEMLDSEVEEIPAPFREPPLASKAIRVLSDTVRGMLNDLHDPMTTLAPIDPWSSIVNLPSLKEAVGYSPHRLSRSHSPMDLESPPAHNKEPSVVGAWPSSSDHSGEPSENEQPRTDVGVAPITTSPESNPKEDDSHEVEAEVDSQSDLDHFMSDSSISSSRRSSPGQGEVVEAPNRGDLKELVDMLQEDVKKLHDHRRKYRLKFNTNVHTISDKITEYDARLNKLSSDHATLTERVDNLASLESAEVVAQLDDLHERLDNLADIDISDLQDQVDGIDGELSNLSRRCDELFAAQESDKEKQEAERAREVDALIKEITQIRDSTREQADVYMADLKASADGLLTQLKSEVARASTLLSEIQAQHSPPTVLKKRKRDDLDDSDGLSERSTPPSSFNGRERRRERLA
ncbi:NWD2 [Coprinopsis cinerea AmutBmut pab1-1]|nr:NWD2 [Coprinopsis cinerea AmutBmut pab1-1]